MRTSRAKAFAVVAVHAFSCVLCLAEPKKEALPPEEKALANSVDSWRLGFFDQLRRFEAGELEFKEKLGPAAPKTFMVGIQNSLEKTALNKYWFKGDYTNAVKLSAARNENESFQVAALPYMGKELGRVTLEPGDLKAADGNGVISAANIAIYVVGRVRSEDSTNADRMSGKLWPDPLLPNGQQAARKLDLALFWVEINVPKDAKPGDYVGDLRLAGDGESLPIKVALRVHAFSLPDRVPFPVAAWTNSTDANREQVYGELLRHGVDPLEAAVWKLGSDDFKAFDGAVGYSLEHGAQVFEVRAPGDAPAKLKPLYDHLVAKGWLDKAIVYTRRDEATAGQFKQENIPYYAGMKKLYPGLRVFAATEWHPDIDKGCDIWLNDLSTGKGMAFAVARHGKAQLWNYYCGIPINCDFFTSRENQPLMLLDRGGVEQRLPFWIAWKYGVKGIFVYAGNHGVPKRLSEDGGLWEERRNGGWIYSGNLNGDGFLLYPPCTPSIRMKILRDGLEDYGYLLELRKLLPRIADIELRRKAEALLAVPGEVLVDPHYFNHNPEGILTAREKLAAMIEQCMKCQRTRIRN